MKKILVLLGFIGSVSLGIAQEHSQAQQPPREKLTPEQKLEKATTELGLSDDQVAQWKGIHKKYKAEMKEDRVENRKAMSKELESTLTPEQLVKFREMRKQNQQERKEQGR